MTESLHTQVKILFDASHYRLNEQLAGWLAKRAGQIYVVGINMDSNQYGHNLTVLYADGPGPHYRAGVWFNSRHSDLEQQVNAALAQGGPSVGALVAVGSNQYGHCLCLIEALPEQ